MPEYSHALDDIPEPFTRYQQERHPQAKATPPDKEKKSPHAPQKTATNRDIFFVMLMLLLCFSDA